MHTLTAASGAFLIAAVALLGCGSTLFAAEALSVESAVRTALENHPSLEVVAWEKNAAEADLDAARATANPEISIGATVLGEDGVGEAIVIAQPLEINGARQARTRAANGGLLASNAAEQAMRHAVAFGAMTAYWDAVLAQATLRVDGENLAYSGTVAEAAQKQFDAGNQPRMHPMKASVEVARARQQLAHSEAEAARAKARLNAAMGLKPWAPLELPNELPLARVAADVQQLSAYAEEHRPEVKQALADVEQASGDEAVAKAARKPDLAVQYLREDFSGPGGVGVMLTIPSLDWGSLRSEQRKASAQLEARRKALEEIYNAIRLDVTVAVATITSTETQVWELRENVLEQSRKLSEIVVIGYQEGATTLLDVLEARQALRDVNLAYQTAIAEHLKALAQLVWAAGVDPLSPAPGGLRIEMVSTETPAAPAPQTDAMHANANPDGSAPSTIDRTKPIRVIGP